MEKYGLPINNENIIKNIIWHDSIIDMSKLNFDLDLDKKIRAAFIFVRNIGCENNINFDDCSFEMKEKYLLEYLTGKIDLNIDILNTTIISIISKDIFNIEMPSILSEIEIIKFINQNLDLINEMKRIMISFPIATINIFNANSYNRNITLDLSGVEKSDYDKINFNNFINLLNYDEFILLSLNIKDFTPCLYTKYFETDHTNNMKQILEKYPFMNLLNLLLGEDDRPRENFLKTIDNMFFI